MQITDFTNEDRRFLSESISKGLTKQKVGSLALGRAIATKAPIRCDLKDVTALTEYVKENLEPHVLNIIEHVSQFVPLNSKEVMRHARDFFMTRAYIANGFNSYNTFSPDPEIGILRSLGLSYYTTKKTLTEGVTREGIALYNGYADLLMTIKG
jgi:hypothetical protein